MSATRKSDETARRNISAAIAAHVAANVAAAPPITQDQCWRVYSLLLARRVTPKRGRARVSQPDDGE